MYQIVPSEISHVHWLAARLRSEDRREIECAGINPRVAIRDSFRNGVMRSTALVDGEIAAMWGLGGTLLSNVGQPWLLTTPVIERVPVTMVKVGREQVAAMLERRSRLENYVAAEYTRACRFLEVLGFTLDEPQVLGSKGAMFRRFWMGSPRRASADH